MSLRSDPRRLPRRNHYQEGPDILFVATQGGRPLAAEPCRNPVAVVRGRARTIRLWAEGASVVDTCGLGGCSRATLFRWRERFERDGLEGVHVAIGDCPAGRVVVVIELAPDPQAGPRRRRGGELDDDLVADEWLASPALADRGKEPVLDLVPLAGPRGKWQTAISRPVSSANFWSSSLHSRRR